MSGPASDDAPAPGSTTDAKPEAQVEGGANAEIAHLRDVISTIRKRSDITAKTLGAIATTALGGIGFAKVTDMSPSDWDRPPSWIWAGLTIVGFVLVAASVVGFIGRLVRVNTPVVLTASSADPMDDLAAGSERPIVERMYSDTARLNGVRSLQAYEARAHRLRRIADRSSPARAEALREAAAAITEDVQLTQVRAATDIVRHRNAAAFNGPGATRLYASLIIGFLLFGIGTDYLDSQRSKDKDAIAFAKSCAEAIKAYKDVSQQINLAHGCPTGTTTTAETTATPSPTVTDAASGVHQDLAARLAACEKAVSPADKGAAQNAADERRCQQIRNLMGDAADQLRP